MAIVLDVHAYYQRTIRWNEVTGVSGVWVKTTDGGSPYTKFADGKTWYPATMVNGAKSQNIPVGGYCYAQPGDGGAHGDVLINENERLGALGLVPVIDIESNAKIHTWGTQEAIDYGRAFCSRAIRRGYRPGIYMNNAMSKATRPDTWPENPVLWLARYGGLKPELRHDVFQYTQSGVMAGTTVDMSTPYNDSYLIKKQQPITTPQGFSEGQMITLPPSSDTTGLPKMPPTPFMPAPGVGKFRMVFIAGPQPVYFVDPVQIVGNSPDSQEIPLELPHHIEPNQTYWLNLNQDSLGVRFPYSSLAEFKAAIYQVA